MHTALPLLTPAELVWLQAHPEIRSGSAGVMVQAALKRIYQGASQFSFLRNLLTADLALGRATPSAANENIHFVAEAALGGVKYRRIRSVRFDALPEPVDGVPTRLKDHQSKAIAGSLALVGHGLFERIMEFARRLSLLYRGRPLPTTDIGPGLPASIQELEKLTRLNAFRLNDIAVDDIREGAMVLASDPWTRVTPEDPVGSIALRHALAHGNNLDFNEIQWRTPRQLLKLCHHAFLDVLTLLYGRNAPLATVHWYEGWRGERAEGVPLKDFARLPSSGIHMTLEIAPR